MWQEISGAVRLTILTIVSCCVIYTAIIWAAGQILTPATAAGSLIRNQTGQIIGSRQVAQKFTQDQYFWCRPSAVDYNAAGAGGSNLSPASTALKKRALKLIQKYGATPNNLLPTDLVTASGSGLDPHITLAGARFQIPRVAEARGITAEKIGNLVDASVSYPGSFITREPLVNVLELNIKLDNLK